MSRPKSLKNPRTKPVSEQEQQNRSLSRISERWEDSGLTALQEKVLPFVLVSPSLTVAAKHAGICEGTIRAWMAKDKKFRSAVFSARRDAYCHSIGRAQETMEKVIDVFLEALAHKDVRVRMTAAKELASIAKSGFEGLQMVEDIQQIKEALQVRELTPGNPAAERESELGTGN